MSRKMSAYARKMRRQPEKSVYQGAAWFNTIQRCRQYSDEPPPGVPAAGNIALAISAQAQVRRALNRLLDHQVASDDVEPHDLLSHAIGITVIRSLQIARTADNPTLPITRAATEALLSVRARWERLGKWGVNATERQALIDAVDAYEAILLASSPAQMDKAARIRHASLQESATP